MPHLEKEENNKRFIKIIIKITIVIKDINPTNFIITKITTILILSHKLQILENKKIKLLFVIDVRKLDIFKKNCKVKKEINKIDINKYNTEQLKNKFLQILQTDSENDSNDSLDDNDSDNEIFQIENSSDRVIVPIQKITAEKG